MRTLHLPSNPARMAFPLFLFAVLCQFGFLRFVTDASGQDLFSILLPVVCLAPLILIPLVLYTHKVAMAVPLFVIIPGATLGFTAAEYLLLGVLFFALLRAFASESRWESPAWIEFLFVIYVLWAALSLQRVVDLREGLEGLRRIVLFCLAFLVGRRVLGPDRALSFMRFMSCLSILVALELTFVILRSGFPLSSLLTRAGALTDLGWGYSNYVAAVAALPVACAIPLAVHGSTGERVLGISAVIAAVFVSIATVSRGGTVVIAIGLLLTILLEARRRSFAPLFLTAVIGSAYLLSPLGQASLARFIQPQDFPSVGIRVIFFTETFRIFRENWLWGIGPDQIAFHTASLIERNPHNIFLKNAVEFGLIGLLLYVSLLAHCIREGWRLRGHGLTGDGRLIALGYMLLLVLAITNASFEPTLEGSQFGIPFWMTAGVFSAWVRAQGDRRAS